MSGKDKWVRRFSVDDTEKHKNGFTIYKITSVLFPINSPEALTIVSVWKRYSDVQQLHKRMRSLHAGLCLRGAFPTLPKHSYFKRFQQEVVEERAKSIKTLLEFVAEHQLLFTSTDFVNFLQKGYPAPERASGVIAAIRSSLRLPSPSPPDDFASIPYADDDSVSNARSLREDTLQPIDKDETDFISKIPIYEAADVDRRQSPKTTSKMSSDSFESLNSIESITSDFYDELSKLSIDKKPAVKRKTVLPDLINFDAPSTSNIDDHKTDTDSVSISIDSVKSSSRMSSYSKTSFLSLSNVDCKTRTEDSYVFEAGYMLNLAARCEDMGDYQRAFDCYKSGIDKMLIGLQGDTDPQRRSLIKEKTNKYLNHAEHIYKKHLCGAEPTPALPARPPARRLSALRGAEPLAPRVLRAAAAGDTRAVKVIPKIPHNLTEFDEYFLKNADETRRPVLPTNIPYMVHLYSYIETDDLIFLILSYAPGGKLLDYIKNYTKSVPNTPSKLNLENVFPDSKPTEANDASNNNIDGDTDDVKELVKNSQKLLSKVDEVLSNVKVRSCEDESLVKVEIRVETPRKRQRTTVPRGALRSWGAELLVAIHALHRAGVVCRDLNPTNILLGDRGQVILTYFTYYPDLDVNLAKLRAAPGSMYIAPELWERVYVEEGAGDEAVCDYWSFGAVMYELLCGVPLSHYHRTTFTSHTILQLPAGLSVEEESLLTQLLTYDPSERLGAGKDGIDEIKNHPYFKSVDWQKVYDSWIVPD